MDPELPQGTKKLLNYKFKLYQIRRLYLSVVAHHHSGKNEVQKMLNSLCSSVLLTWISGL